MEPMYITIIILIIAIVLFVTEWVSYSTTALFVPIALYITGILDASEIVSGLTNGGVLLCAAMSVIGGTILSSGLAKNIGDIITKKFKTEKMTMMALMFVCIVMSSFLSNMGTAAVMVPIAIGVCQAKKEYKLSKLLMAVAFGCTLGGMNTLIGTPVNLLARSTLEEFALGTIGFFEFAKTGIPMLIIGLLYMYFIGYKLSPTKSINVEKMSFAQNSDLNNKKTQITVGVIFICIIIGMGLERVINIPVHITAFIGVLVLLFTKTISDKQTYSFIEWPAVFLVAGMLPLANAMVKTGAADFIAQGIMSIVGDNLNVTLFIVILFLLSATLTQFMSNTACAALLLPISISIATNLNCNPISLVMAITIGAQCAFVTPIATPHNTYIMGIANYKFSDFVKVGLPMLILCFVAAIIIIPLAWPL